MNHGVPPGWRLQMHETLASTQATAILAAQAGDPGALAVLAHEQTAGRGSRGRRWVGGAGNLHLSAVLRPNRLPPVPGFWALMAGVALHEALAAHLPEPFRLKLKWPNDLLLDGAKLGGILIDSALTPAGHLDWVVIGIGVNLHSAPAIEGRATASLAGGGPQPATLAAGILAAVERWIARPLPVLREAWLDRAHPIGTWLDIATSACRTAGAFAGLSDDGALLLAGRANAITTGEVFALTPPSRARGA